MGSDMYFRAALVAITGILAGALMFIYSQLQSSADFIQEALVPPTQSSVMDASNVAFQQRVHVDQIHRFVMSQQDQHQVLLYNGRYNLVTGTQFSGFNNFLNQLPQMVIGLLNHHERNNNPPQVSTVGELQVFTLDHFPALNVGGANQLPPHATYTSGHHVGFIAFDVSGPSGTHTDIVDQFVANVRAQSNSSATQTRSMVFVERFVNGDGSVILVISMGGASTWIS